MSSLTPGRAEGAEGALRVLFPCLPWSRLCDSQLTAASWVQGPERLRVRGARSGRIGKGSEARMFWGVGVGRRSVWQERERTYGNEVMGCWDSESPRTL